MDCCAQKKSVTTELKDALCPSCQKKGRLVGRETSDSLLSAEYKAKVAQSSYMFCQTPDCDVVYYSENPDHRFLKAHLKVPVTAKDLGLGVPVCYCFNVTRQKVLDDLQSTGTTNVYGDISQKIKEGLCACETMNPQGNCCLGNVAKWIKQAKILTNEIVPRRP